MNRQPVRQRPEARLERDVLLASRDYPNLLLLKNEVGQGYYKRVKDALRSALDRHPEAWRIVEETLNRHRLTFGLGVGSPDLVGSLAGRALGLELKSESGRLTADQQRWLQAAQRRGALVGAPRSVDNFRRLIERWS